MSITGTRVHSVIFVFSLKLNTFPFSAYILTFSTQNQLILTQLTHFDTTHFFYKYYNIIVFIEKKGCIKVCKIVKIKWFCVEKVRIEALKRNIFNLNEITKITECTRVPVVSISVPCKQHHRMTIYYKCQSR